MTLPLILYNLRIFRHEKVKLWIVLSQNGIIKWILYLNETVIVLQHSCAVLYSKIISDKWHLFVHNFSFSTSIFSYPEIPLSGRGKVRKWVHATCLRYPDVHQFFRQGPKGCCTPDNRLLGEHAPVLIYPWCVMEDSRQKCRIPVFT